jgi:hypothetical protein
MTDDGLVPFGDERNDGWLLLSEGVHDIDFDVAFEGGLVDPVHCDAVAWLFISN